MIFFVKFQKKKKIKIKLDKTNHALWTEYETFAFIKNHKISAVFEAGT